MRIDLSCPAELFRTAMPTEGIPAVSMIMFNLSDRVITSAEVTAVLLSASGEEKARVVFRGRALNGRPHSTFSMNVPMAPDPAAKQAEIHIDKVWFSDNDVWRRGEYEEAEYTPHNLPASPALTNLKYVAGETAVGYPSYQNGLWICVCGRPNADREMVCARCRRDRESVFAMFNRETVEKQIALREKQLELSTRSVREETGRLQRIREEEYIQKKATRRRRIIILGCLLMFLVVTSCVMGLAIPALRMASANKAMENGDYESARETLKDLSGFSGAEEKIAECDWQIIRQEANYILAPEEVTPDTLDAMKSISGQLRDIPNREEAISLADEIDLRRGRRLLQEAQAMLALEVPAPEAPEGDVSSEDSTTEDDQSSENGTEPAKEKKNPLWRDGIAVDDSNPESIRCRRLVASARQAVSQLPKDQPERIELELACLYTEAQDAMNRRNFLTARETFRSLGDYRDSSGLAIECLYQWSLMQLEAEHYEEAIDGLTPIMDYRDSRNRILQCHYMLGEGLAAEGLLEEACNEYLKAGDWSSAKAKLQATTYKMAEAAFIAEDYEKALELCSSIPGHTDADLMNWACRYKLGNDAYKDREYTLAYRMYSGIPENTTIEEYKNVAEKRIECAYEAGKLAIAREDWTLAIELLTAAGNYRDAEKQLAKVQKKMEELYPGMVPETTEPAETDAPENPGASDSRTEEPGTDSPDSEGQGSEGPNSEGSGTEGAAANGSGSDESESAGAEPDLGPAAVIFLCDGDGKIPPVAVQHFGGVIRLFMGLQPGSIDPVIADGQRGAEGQQQGHQQDYSNDFFQHGMPPEASVEIVESF